MKDRWVIINGNQKTWENMDDIFDDRMKVSSAPLHLGGAITENGVCNSKILIQLLMDSLN